MKFLNLGIIILFIIVLAIPSLAFVSDNIQMTKNIKYDKSSTVEPKPFGSCPLDDTIVTTSIIMTPEICYVNDIDNDGILIITGNSITVDCNGLTLIGNGGGKAISIQGSSVTLKNCIVKDYSTGIATASSSTLENNLVESNRNGIEVSGRFNNLTNNEVINNNGYGIFIEFAQSMDLNHVLKNNTMNGNGYNLFINGGGLPWNLRDYILDIDTSNTINGKPVYYLRNINNQIFDSSINAGFFACIQCNNVTVKDLTLERNSHGVLFFETQMSTASNITSRYNNYGISIAVSDDAIIQNSHIELSGSNGIRFTTIKNSYILNNTIYDSSWDGIYLFNTTNVIIQNNVISGNADGISIRNPSPIVPANVIINNSINNNGYGISIVGSSENNISNNEINYNSKYGIDVYGHDNDIINNTIIGNGEEGISLEAARNNKIIENLIQSNVNRGIYVNGGRNNEIRNNFIRNNLDGIRLTLSDFNIISENNLVDNTKNGLYLDASNNVTIDKNLFESNGLDGIFVYSSHNNTFIENALCDNTFGVRFEWFPSNNHVLYNNFKINRESPQVYDDASSIFDDGVTGNYWSDYNGTDGNGDGIGDTPYVIDGDSQDNYPLINPNSNAPKCFEDTTPPLAPTLFKAVLTGANYEDVEISWYASFDEGQTGGTTNYELWKSTEFNGVYSYVRQIPVTGSPTYTIIQSLEGDGTPSNYFYFIRAVDTSNNSADSWYAGKFAQFLKQDWKFISVPLEQWNTSLETVLQTLDYNQVRYYDQGEWKSYWKFKSYKSNLKDIDHKMGFWIHTTSNDYLTTAGLVPMYTEIPLNYYWNDKNNRNEGWNMVGYPSFINRTVSEALAGIPWVRIEGFDPNLPPFHLKKLLPTDIMSAGNAYWIEVSNNAIWNVTNLNDTTGGKKFCKEVMQITNDSFTEFFPDIYRGIIVYTNQSSGIDSRDIYMYNISSGVTIQITNDTTIQDVGAQIYDDIIVWVHGSLSGSGKEDIYMYNISSGITTPITIDFGLNRQPDISGDIIVYTHSVGPSEIYIYNISSSQNKLLGYGFNPDIDGDMIAWDISSDISVYNLSSNQSKILTGSPEKYFPSIHKNFIGYSDNRNGRDDVYLYDLSTDTETRISYDINDFESVEDIYGDILFWTNFNNSTIYLYNISEGKNYLFYSTPAYDNDLIIYENELVWRSEPNIYYCELI